MLYGRILNPASKKATLEAQNRYFEPFNLTLDSVYEYLSLMKDIKEDLQLHLHSKISETYGIDTSLIFFDVTNYYFETEIENDLLKKGLSKEKKTTPIVQMSLAIDREGLPVGYELFPGNGDGYIVSQKVRGSSKAFIDKIL